jgi:hypothetical protein
MNISSDSALDKSVGANNTNDTNKHTTNNNTPAKDNSNPNLVKALALLNNISDPDSDLDMCSFFTNNDTTDNATKNNNEDKDNNEDEDKDKDTDNTNNGMSLCSQPAQCTKKTTTMTTTTATKKTAPKKQDAVHTEGKGKEVAKLATSGQVTTPPKCKTVAKTVAKMAAKHKEEEEEELLKCKEEEWAEQLHKKEEVAKCKEEEEELLKCKEEEQAEQLRKKEEGEVRAEWEEDTQRQCEEKEKEDKRKCEKRAMEEEERANHEEQAQLQHDQRLESMRKTVEDLEKAREDALQALQWAQLAAKVAPENTAAKQQVMHVSPPPAPTKAMPELATIVSVADMQLSLEPALPTACEVVPVKKSHFDRGMFPELSCVCLFSFQTYICVVSKL